MALSLLPSSSLPSMQVSTAPPMNSLEYILPILAGANLALNTCSFGPCMVLNTSEAEEEMLHLFCETTAVIV